MITEEEKARRRLAVRNVIANQRLAGLALDPETIADLDAYARGEKTLLDAINHVDNRYPVKPATGQRA